MARVTVVADRSKGYQGPIAVTLRNLPPNVIAGQNIIPQGMDRVSLDLMAAPQAAPGDKPNISAWGQLANTDNQQVTSPGIVVSIQATPHPTQPKNPAIRPVSQPAQPKNPPPPRPVPIPRPKSR